MPQGISATTTADPAAIQVISRFKTSVNFLTIFNPTHQVDYTLDRRRAYMGQAPTLGLVGKAFAYGTAKTWVSIQIGDLAEFSGCKSKLTIAQIDELAALICSEYGYMKVTELMDFFRKFKSGDYGKFYGAVDPMVITCALRDFEKYRKATIADFEREEREERDRSDPYNQKFKQLYLENERMSKFYCNNFRSIDFTREDFSQIWWLFKLGYERSNHGYVE